MKNKMSNLLFKKSNLHNYLIILLIFVLLYIIYYYQNEKNYYNKPLLENYYQTNPITLRFQSTYTSGDIFHEYAMDFVKKVNEMSGGRLKIELLPSGAVVKNFDLLDAVNKGTLDGGYGVLAYHYGKSPAFALWGSGPAFGMDANTLLAWHYYGGGKEILKDIYKSIGITDVVSFLCGPMPTQPLGWFKKPITNPNDLKGLKYRTVGLAVDMFKELGATVILLPGGEIVPAMERGLLDGAEFYNPTSDRALGFPNVSKVCMVQSFHQSSEQFEILFNKTKYDLLPTDLKAIIKYATQAFSAEISWKTIDRYSKDYYEMMMQGVKFYKTPDSILRAQLDAWDKVVAKKSAENPLFKEVVDSQKTFAQRAEAWQNEYMVDYKIAYNRYFLNKGRDPRKKL